MLKLLNNNRFMFIVLMSFSVAVSVILKNENLFDFYNYHYYNPWAWLNGRIGYDVAPASYLTFLNPLIDLPRYFTIVLFNEHINWFYAVNGLWFGWLLFVFYKTLRLIFDTDTVRGCWEVLFTMVIAVTGRMTWFNISSSNNEIILAFINFCGLYFLFKEIKGGPQKQNVKSFIWAGLILGAGLGLKSTSFAVCVAAGLSLIIGFKWLEKPIKFISIFTLCGLVGYLVVNAWWMYKMYDLYDNPFFPFFNNIFQSEYFIKDNISFDNFVPTFNQLAFCPFLALLGNVCNGEGVGADFRLQIFYILAIVWIIYLIIKRKIKYYYQNRPMEFFFYLFLLIYYLVWAKFLGVQHYFIVLEMFGALLVVQTFSVWFRKNKWRPVLYVLSYVLMVVFVSVTLTEDYFNNLQNKDKVIDVEPIKLPNHTLVKLYNMPVAAIVPEIAKYNNDFRAVGMSQFIDVLPYTYTDMTRNGKFKDVIDNLEKQYENQVIIFRLSLNKMQSRIIRNRMQEDLRGKKCRVLRSVEYLFGNPMIICVPHNWVMNETDEKK